MGECHVHAGISPADLRAQVAADPEAEVLVHPECGCASSAIWLAGVGDLPAERTHILSTGACSTPPATMTAKTALIATEIGMLHQLRKVNQQTNFLPMNPKASCRFMKMITPELLVRVPARGPRRDRACRPRSSNGPGVRSSGWSPSATLAGARMTRATSTSLVIGAGVAGLRPRSVSPRPRRAPAQRGRRQHAVGAGRRSRLRSAADDPTRSRARHRHRGRGFLRSRATLRLLVEEGPQRVAELIAHGRSSSTATPTALSRTLEGGHRRPRSCMPAATPRAPRFARARAAVQAAGVQIIDDGTVGLTRSPTPATSSARSSTVTASRRIAARAVVLATGGSETPIWQAPIRLPCAVTASHSRCAPAPR